MKLGEWLSGLPRGVVVRGGVMQDTATGKWRAVFMTDGKDFAPRTSSQPASRRKLTWTRQFRHTVCKRIGCSREDRDEPTRRGAHWRLARERLICYVSVTIRTWRTRCRKWLCMRSRDAPSIVGS